MAISDKDFQDLREKVNSVGQTQNEIVIPQLTEITKKLDNLAFVSQKDFDSNNKSMNKTTDDLDKRLKAVEELVNKGGVKIANFLSNSVFKIFMGALAVGVVIIIVIALVKIAPAIYGGTQ